MFHRIDSSFRADQMDCRSRFGHALSMVLNVTAIKILNLRVSTIGNVWTGLKGPVRKLVVSQDNLPMCLQRVIVFK